jgi:hypothetical protein
MAAAVWVFALGARRALLRIDGIADVLQTIPRKEPHSKSIRYCINSSTMPVCRRAGVRRPEFS